MENIIYGNSYLVKEELKKRIKDLMPTPTEWQYFIYDGTEVPLKEIVEQANTAGFFADYKLIVVNNSYFLSNKKVKVTIENDLSDLENYLLNPNINTDIIFVVESDKLDEKNPVVKKIKKGQGVTYLSEPTKDELPRIVKKMFEEKNIAIEYSAVVEFISRIKGDLVRAKTEIEKLAVYQEKINFEDVSNLITPDINYTVFNLADALIAKNLSKVMNIYLPMQEKNVEPVSLIALIARQYRQVYQVLMLNKQGNSKEEIASILSIPSYPVQLITEKKKSIDLEQIIQTLVKLSDLDITIKLFDYETRHTKFELFLIDCCL